MTTKELFIDCAGKVAIIRRKLLDVQSNPELNASVKNFLNRSISDLRVAEASIDHLLELSNEVKN